MATLHAQLANEISTWDIGTTPLTVGRRPDNAITLNDSFVSGRHALVGRDANGRCYVEDLKSSNGTLLNGKRVERAWLQDGDIVRIGNIDLRFAGDAAAPAAPVKLPGAPPASSFDPSVTAEAALLDELVGSIRTHREREQRDRVESQARLRSEWERLLILAEQLRQKVSTDPRVKHFGIDRRAADVIIRMQRSPDAPQQIITLALRHPDHSDHALSGIWLLRTGEPDRCLPGAQIVAAELVRELAFLLA
ncbi:FHA domain-containing protein [Sinimarinibacterium sp. CAU 1509]|uniref:FHA domain-containing protein n=1 Tax=Sinimarinibacterium sp. CAU 1509 TaxID=2562283 RepID=UPI0010AD3CD1|nr:FHA domain-containing protein [Sinimarinibacterium sp. CAU 1509]TJY58992.1 FHA domain-containing protein [Sinimarinibacterium sp. CAU 1509]